MTGIRNEAVICIYVLFFLALGVVLYIYIANMIIFKFCVGVRILSRCPLYDRSGKLAWNCIRHYCWELTLCLKENKWRFHFRSSFHLIKHRLPLPHNCSHVFYAYYRYPKNLQRPELVSLRIPACRHILTKVLLSCLWLLWAFSHLLV